MRPESRALAWILYHQATAQLTRTQFSTKNGVSPGGSVKKLPVIQETQFPALNWEDPLEEEMATHSSVLAWRILWTEEPGGKQCIGSQRVGHNCVINTFRALAHFFYFWSSTSPVVIMNLSL